jgi:hypothetical protein
MVFAEVQIQAEENFIKNMAREIPALKGWDAPCALTSLLMGSESEVILFSLC